MRKKFIGILLIIIFIQNLKAQEITSNNVFFYKFEFQRDSTNQEKKLQEMMVLISNGKESIYKSYPGMKRDSIVTADFARGNYTISFKNMPKSNVFHQVYYNKNEDIQIFDKVVNKYFSFPADKISWKIDNEKKKIGEFNCQRAFCVINNRKFEAWFTNEIPLNDGPYRFKGLPGLIVQVYDEKKYFVFTLEGIKKQNITTEIPKNVINTTHENFIKERGEFYNDPVGKAKLYMGNNVILADPRIINDRFKKHNLFLD
ncbi:hypothetical protein ACM39_17850 [Chryseobacterium sp. FH2]|uniref:GLPGLI family protein n=1 Tax=Chryseobacterium sp. FH2 TaxID=1674291 RepID=UPI00065B0423|nr:GLPGLI family protein [Chryseobacterium sp. FH2]KMQ61280.1 hypothetical protein ACM39_17850 [Chryseobacterium sp. FH2]